MSAFPADIAVLDKPSAAVPRRPGATYRLVGAGLVPPPRTGRHAARAADPKRNTSLGTTLRVRHMRHLLHH